ncbi:hypothetical protein SprV_0501891000 [Sparganum proliferum]
MTQLRWNGHLVHMDGERLPKRLFCGDVVADFRRQGVWRYRHTLQIDSVNLEDLARNRSTWRGTVRKGAAIYEANCIIAAKAKLEARKSQLPPSRSANNQPPSTCLRCLRTFRAQVGLTGNRRTICNTRPALTDAYPPTSAPPPHVDKQP